MGRRIIVWFLFLALVSCQRTPTEPELRDILDRLRALPGVTVAEIAPHYGYPRAFQIDVVQPVDHRNPGGAQFTQRMYLSHVDETMPMVFAPGGYGVTDRSGQEIAGILGTNCLSVTHRFFPDARPDPLDWQYLTIEQSANDHHRIVTLFKQVYEGPWVSSGVSKSGLTSLFHRRFFPDDVDATLAYVSPFMFGTADARFADYLANTGTQEDRDRIHAFQRMVLENRDSLQVPFRNWFAENGYTYSGNPDEDLEGAVASYDWNYWQRHVFDTGEIPGLDASWAEMIDHLAIVVRLYSASDEWDGYFDPWVYQAFTEIGYPQRDYSHIQDLFVYEHGNTGESVFDEYGVELVYRPETVQDIHQWLLADGDGIVYIYGSVDPWTGGAIELIGQADALRFIHQGGDHSTRIEDLAEQRVVLAKLEEWMGIEIDAIAKRGAPALPDIDGIPSLSVGILP